MSARFAAAKKSHDDVILEALGSGKVVLQSRSLVEFPDTLFNAGAAAEKWWMVEPLKLLDLSFNAITRIPSGIKQFFETLTTLRLQGNALTFLPPELWECTALKTLDLAKNRIHVLPDGINDLHALVELDLSYNQLTSLPPLTGTRMLELLRLKENKLHELPETFDSLSRLLELDVSHNELRRLPESIGACGRLKTLTAQHNTLSVLPRSMSSLAGLQLLDLRQNHLSSLAPLPDADALTEVLLGWNALTELSGTDVARSSITTLDVSNNKLTGLPEELRGMKALHTLDISNNDIQNLPAWLGFMSALARLQVDGNPLRTMRRAVITGGTPSLKAYLKTRATQDEAIAWEREFSNTGRTPPRSYGRPSGGAAPAASAPARGFVDRADVMDSAVAATVPGVSLRPYGDAAADGDVIRHKGVAGRAEPRTATTEAPAYASTRPPEMPRAPSDVASAVRAVADEHMDAAWTHALRDAATTGRVVVSPTSVPAKLTCVRLEVLSGGKLDMLPRMKALVLDGHAIDPDFGIPEGLQLVAEQLQEVSLSNNSLTRIPVGLLRPPRSGLEALRIPVVGLRILNLSRNAIADDGLGPLPETLEELDLRNNALQRPPAVCAQLPRLRVLLLGENRIMLRDSASPTAHTPDDDAFWIPSLETLDLSRNRLTRVPSAVLALPKLSTLNLADNELAVIPPHLAFAPCLQSLNVEGNPQRSIRFALTQKGAAAVLAYLRSRVPPGTENQFIDMYSHETSLSIAARELGRADATSAVSDRPSREMIAHAVTPHTARGARERAPDIGDHSARSVSGVMGHAVTFAHHPSAVHSTPSSSRGPTPAPPDDVDADSYRSAGRGPPSVPYMQVPAMAYAMPYAVHMPYPAPMHVVDARGGILPPPWAAPPGMTYMYGGAPPPVMGTPAGPSIVTENGTAYAHAPPYGPDAGQRTIVPMYMSGNAMQGGHTPHAMSADPRDHATTSARSTGSGSEPYRDSLAFSATEPPAVRPAGGAAPTSAEVGPSRIPETIPAAAKADDSPAARIREMQAQMAELQAQLDRGGIEKALQAAHRRQIILLRAQETRLRKEAGL